jgi:transposase
VQILYQRVAAIDVHKKEVRVALRVPGQEPGTRRMEIRRYKTFFGVLKEMTGWLAAEGVTHVAMEASGIFTMPVFHVLMESGLFDQVLVCNAAHVKNVPGRKTDSADAAWLAELLEVGLLRGSFIPPADIKAIQDLVRYRRKLVESRTAEINRLGKALEDAGIKLGSVASDVLGKSGRAMIEALIDGERRGAVLADLAKGLLRKKIPDLSMALDGRFNDQHALMCRLHLDHIDHLTVMIARLDAEIEQVVAPFTRERELLVTVPGIGPGTAAAVISEIGVNMGMFPTDAHLASWAGLCPGNHESAGKRKSGKPRKGNPHLPPILVEAAWAAVRTQGRLRARYDRLVRRFGGHRNPDAKKKAIFAIAHTLAIIIWHVLHDGVPYTDLGSDFYTRRDDPEREKNRLIAKLTTLGYNVSVTPGATTS